MVIYFSASPFGIMILQQNSSLLLNEKFVPEKLPTYLPT
jgi:hypothetical protein